MIRASLARKLSRSIVVKKAEHTTSTVRKARTIFCENSILHHDTEIVLLYEVLGKKLADLR